MSTQGSAESEGVSFSVLRHDRVKTFASAFGARFFFGVVCSLVSLIVTPKFDLRKADCVVPAALGRYSPGTLNKHRMPPFQSSFSTTATHALQRGLQDLRPSAYL